MLPADWWIRWRDRDPVEDKLARAHVKFWITVLGEALRKNKEIGRQPSSWEAFADAIHRDWANFSRRRAGGHARLSPQEFLAMASVVGLPTSALFPDTGDWIARTTKLLCRDSIGPDEAEIYARYSVAHLQLDRSRAIEEVAAQLCNGDRAKVGQVVGKVTDHLGRTLAKLAEDGR